MVYVRLAQEWTDSTGTDHAAGAMVDVDAATLARLEARGVVAESGGDTDGFPGPSSNGGSGGSGGGDDDTDGFPGPS
jgi:hypothetical protein